jgi:DNA-binding response OmpR family regulator
VKILVADDDAVSRAQLEGILTSWGHRPVVVPDGLEAWAWLSEDPAPVLAILDWMMPGVDGPELCRRAREAFPDRPMHLMLLTARDSREEVIEGLAAGADDYLTKPFDPAELKARIQVGTRVVTLQADLVSRVAELEDALGRVQQLQGLLPICSYCKKIRDDDNYWHQVESYVSEHTAAQFSHGICPECYEGVVKPHLEDVLAKRGSRKR